MPSTWHSNPDLLVLRKFVNLNNCNLHWLQWEVYIGEFDLEILRQPSSTYTSKHLDLNLEKVLHSCARFLASKVREKPVSKPPKMYPDFLLFTAIFVNTAATMTTVETMAKPVLVEANLCLFRTVRIIM